MTSEYILQHSNQSLIDFRLDKIILPPIYVYNAEELFVLRSFVF